MAFNDSRDVAETGYRCGAARQVSRGGQAQPQAADDWTHGRHGRTRQARRSGPMGTAAHCVRDASSTVPTRPWPQPGGPRRPIAEAAWPDRLTIIRAPGVVTSNYASPQSGISLTPPAEPNRESWPTGAEAMAQPTLALHRLVYRCQRFHSRPQEGAVLRDQQPLV